MSPEVRVVAWFIRHTWHGTPSPGSTVSISSWQSRQPHRAAATPVSQSGGTGTRCTVGRGWQITPPGGGTSGGGGSPPVAAPAPGPPRRSVSLESDSAGLVVELAILGACQEGSHL